MQFLPKSQTTLDVYLINMDGATERLASMTSSLAGAGLDWQRVPGIKGRELTFPIREFSELSYKLLHGRRRTPPEVGCYLSHIECVRRFLAGHADFALILEDDVTFQDNIVDTLDRAAQCSGDWDLLRLTTVNNGRKFAFRHIGEGQDLAIALTREKGAGAYMINREAAKWIVHRLLPMRLAYDIAFDLEYLDGLDAAFIIPLPASQESDHETQIQMNIQDYKLPKWRYLTVLPYRAYLEVSRFFLRGAKLIWKKYVRPS